MIQYLLILLVGVALGVAITARLERKHTGEREVRLQVHELELMTAALVRARAALWEAVVRRDGKRTGSPGYDAVLADALSAVKLALGESNGHAPKYDDGKSTAWL